MGPKITTTHTQPTTPIFVFNIFYDEAQGEQKCSCCLSCVQRRQVPGAQVYGACGGPGSEVTGLALNASAKPRQRVYAGMLLRYKVAVSISNRTKSMGWSSVKTTTVVKGWSKTTTPSGVALTVVSACVEEKESRRRSRRRGVSLRAQTHTHTRHACLTAGLARSLTHKLT